MMQANARPATKGSPRPLKMVQQSASGPSATVSHMMPTSDVCDAIVGMSYSLTDARASDAVISTCLSTCALAAIHRLSSLMDRVSTPTVHSTTKKLASDAFLGTISVVRTASSTLTSIASTTPQPVSASNARLITQ